MIGQGHHYEDTSSKYHPQTDTQNNKRQRDSLKNNHVYVLYRYKNLKIEKKVTVITEDYQEENI